MSRNPWLLIIQGDGNEPDKFYDIPATYESAAVLVNLRNQGIYRWSLFANENDQTVLSPLTGTAATTNMRPSGESEGSSSQPDSIVNGDSFALQNLSSGGMQDASQNSGLNPDQLRIDNIIENLPTPLKTVVRTWSGDAREQVVQKILQGVQTDIEGMYQHHPSAWSHILRPLTGPEGVLCAVERQGTQGGMTCVTCRYGNCNERFAHNPVEKFAQHLLGKHWRIHPFKCATCDYRSNYPQTLHRHERKCASS